MKKGQKLSKRLMDIAIAFPSVIFLSPLILTIAILSRIAIGTPVFFKQDRPGINGDPFTLYKFRTMREARDKYGNLLPDANRLTRLGNILRTTSLDELPELLNIIRGEMSIVGPRPLLMQYMDRYTAEQNRRHEVKPGLTGWCQINGRNALKWEDKLRMDVWYVDNQSFRLDILIILTTVRKVISREGINHQGEATMSEFIGTISS